MDDSPNEHVTNARNIHEVPANKKLLFNLMPRKFSCLKRPFHDQGQSFLYIATIKSNQVKVCDNIVHPCLLSTTGNIVQYILYSTMF